MFDARFVESPMGRARGGRSMVWDSRGTMNAGKTKKAENWDADVFAAEMADETEAAEASADKNKFGNNTNVRAASWRASCCAPQQLRVLRRSVCYLNNSPLLSRVCADGGLPEQRPRARWHERAPARA